MKKSVKIGTDIITHYLEECSFITTLVTITWALYDYIFFKKTNREGEE